MNEVDQKDCVGRNLNADSFSSTRSVKNKKIKNEELKNGKRDFKP